MSKEGRPTKYKPEYVNQLLEHMKSGLSFASFAGVIGVTRDCLYKWEKEYPEFLYAHQQGIDANLLFWEKGGRQISIKGGGNSNAWKYNMSNRHGWREKSEVQNTGDVTLNIDPQDAKL